MRIFVVTVFPDLVSRFCDEALLGKARESGSITVEAINPRDFTHDKHRSVDDGPYGGGSGMVMRPGPLVDAIEKAESLSSERPHRVLMTPQGAPFSQEHARRFASLPALTLVCGRYEGVDERVRSYVDEELSMGDFVLMGGEVAALAVIEASARLVAGVLGNPDSFRDESHSEGRLEYPHYTRPAEFRGASVPDVLLSGNHAEIARWRRQQSLRRTIERRPDLIESLSDEERAWIESWSKA
jgi:tRNA (guanine37-N1)-methyltransferase